MLPQGTFRPLPWTFGLQPRSAVLGRETHSLPSWIPVSKLVPHSHAMHPYRIATNQRTLRGGRRGKPGSTESPELCSKGRPGLAHPALQRHPPGPDLAFKPGHSCPPQRAAQPRVRFPPVHAHTDWITHHGEAVRPSRRGPADCPLPLETTKRVDWLRGLKQVIAGLTGLLPTRRLP